MTALYFNSTKFDIFNELQKITKCYNNKKNLYDNLSPYDRIFSTKSPNYIKLFKNVDLEDEDKKIKNLRNKILKKYPIGAKVRLATTKKEFAKDSISEKFTSSFYYISAVKNPILSIYPFRFRIKNDKNIELTGLFLKHELKVV